MSGHVRRDDSSNLFQWTEEYCTKKLHQQRFMHRLWFWKYYTHYFFFFHKRSRMAFWEIRHNSVQNFFVRSFSLFLSFFFFVFFFFWYVPYISVEKKILSKAKTKKHRNSECHCTAHTYKTCPLWKHYGCIQKTEEIEKERGGFSDQKEISRYRIDGREWK